MSNSSFRFFPSIGYYKTHYSSLWFYVPYFVSVQWLFLFHSLKWVGMQLGTGGSIREYGIFTLASQQNLPQPLVKNWVSSHQIHTRVYRLQYELVAVDFSSPILIYFILDNIYFLLFWLLDGVLCLAWFWFSANNLRLNFLLYWKKQIIKSKEIVTLGNNVIDHKLHSS